jgi:hypothetical protein
MFGATGMIGPCGIATPPYGTTVFGPSLAGLKKSHMSTKGWVLQPDNRHSKKIGNRRRFMVSIRDERGASG